MIQVWNSVPNSQAYLALVAPCRCSMVEIDRLPCKLRNASKRHRRRGSDYPCCLHRKWRNVASPIQRCEGHIAQPLQLCHGFVELIALFLQITHLPGRHIDPDSHLRLSPFLFVNEQPLADFFQ